METVEKATGETVYVDKAKAVEIIRRSRYGRNRWTRGAEPANATERLMWEFRQISFGGANPSARERAIKEEFDQWLQWVLMDGFVADVQEESAARDDWKGAIRQSPSGKTEYSESALRRWLEEKWQHQIISRFGPI